MPFLPWLCFLILAFAQIADADKESSLGKALSTLRRHKRHCSCLSQFAPVNCKCQTDGNDLLCRCDRATVLPQCSCAPSNAVLCLPVCQQQCVQSCIAQSQPIAQCDHICQGTCDRSCRSVNTQKSAIVYAIPSASGNTEKLWGTLDSSNGLKIPIAQLVGSNGVPIAVGGMVAKPIEPIGMIGNSGTEGIPSGVLIGHSGGILSGSVIPIGSSGPNTLHLGQIGQNMGTFGGAAGFSGLSNGSPGFSVGSSTIPISRFPPPSPRRLQILPDSDRHCLCSLTDPTPCPCRCIPVCTDSCIQHCSGAQCALPCLHGCESACQRPMSQKKRFRAHDDPDCGGRCEVSCGKACNRWSRGNPKNAIVSADECTDRCVSKCRANCLQESPTVQRTPKRAETDESAPNFSDEIFPQSTEKKSEEEEILETKKSKSAEFERRRIAAKLERIDAIARATGEALGEALSEVNAKLENAAGIQMSPPEETAESQRIASATAAAPFDHRSVVETPKTEEQRKNQTEEAEEYTEEELKMSGAEIDSHSAENTIDRRRVESATEIAVMTRRIGNSMETTPLFASEFPQNSAEDSESNGKQISEYSETKANSTIQRRRKRQIGPKVIYQTDFIVPMDGRPHQLFIPLQQLLAAADSPQPQPSQPEDFADLKLPPWPNGYPPIPMDSSPQPPMGQYYVFPQSGREGTQIVTIPLNIRTVSQKPQQSEGSQRIDAQSGGTDATVYTFLNSPQPQRKSKTEEKEEKPKEEPKTTTTTPTPPPSTPFPVIPLQIQNAPSGRPAPAAASRPPPPLTPGQIAQRAAQFAAQHSALTRPFYPAATPSPFRDFVPQPYTRVTPPSPPPPASPPPPPASLNPYGAMGQQFAPASTALFSQWNGYSAATPNGWAPYPTAPQYSMASAAPAASPPPPPQYSTPPAAPGNYAGYSPQTYASPYAPQPREVSQTPQPPQNYPSTYSRETSTPQPSNPQIPQTAQPPAVTQSPYLQNPQQPKYVYSAHSFPRFLSSASVYGSVPRAAPYIQPRAQPFAERSYPQPQPTISQQPYPQSPTAYRSMAAATGNRDNAATPQKLSPIAINFNGPVHFFAVDSPENPPNISNGESASRIPSGYPNSEIQSGYPSGFNRGIDTQLNIQKDSPLNQNSQNFPAAGYQPKYPKVKIFNPTNSQRFDITSASPPSASSPPSSSPKPMSDFSNPSDFQFSQQYSTLSPNSAENFPNQRDSVLSPKFSPETSPSPPLVDSSNFAAHYSQIARIAPAYPQKPTVYEFARPPAMGGTTRSPPTTTVAAPSPTPISPPTDATDPMPQFTSPPPIVAPETVTPMDSAEITTPIIPLNPTSPIAESIVATAEPIAVAANPIASVGPSPIADSVIHPTALPQYSYLRPVAPPNPIASGYWSPIAFAPIQSPLSSTMSQNFPAAAPKLPDVTPIRSPKGFPMNGNPIEKHRDFATTPMPPPVVPISPPISPSMGPPMSPPNPSSQQISPPSPPPMGPQMGPNSLSPQSMGPPISPPPSFPNPSFSSPQQMPPPSSPPLRPQMGSLSPPTPPMSPQPLPPNPSFPSPQQMSPALPPSPQPPLPMQPKNLIRIRTETVTAIPQRDFPPSPPMGFPPKYPKISLNPPPPSSPQIQREQINPFPNSQWQEIASAFIPHSAIPSAIPNGKPIQLLNPNPMPNPQFGNPQMPAIPPASPPSPQFSVSSPQPMGIPAMSDPQFAPSPRIPSAQFAGNPSSPSVAPVATPSPMGSPPIASAFPSPNIPRRPPMSPNSPSPPIAAPQSPPNGSPVFASPSGGNIAAMQRPVGSPPMGTQNSLSSPPVVIPYSPRIPSPQPSAIPYGSPIASPQNQISPQPTPPQQPQRPQPIYSPLPTVATYANQFSLPSQRQIGNYPQQSTHPLAPPNTLSNSFERPFGTPRRPFRRLHRRPLVDRPPSPFIATPKSFGGSSAAIEFFRKRYADAAARRPKVAEQIARLIVTTQRPQITTTTAATTTTPETTTTEETPKTTTIQQTEEEEETTTEENNKIEENVGFQSNAKPIQSETVAQTDTTTEIPQTDPTTETTETTENPTETTEPTETQTTTETPTEATTEATTQSATETLSIGGGTKLSLIPPGYSADCVAACDQMCDGICRPAGSDQPAPCSATKCLERCVRRCAAKDSTIPWK